MIYELRRDTLRPCTLPAALERFGAACEQRRSGSPPGGVWYTDVGPLNQIVHVWGYASLAERERIRAAAGAGPAAPAWPPALDEFAVRREVGLYAALPGPAMLQPGRVGPYFELRSYFVRAAGGLQRYLAGWEQKLAERLALSPLTVALHTELGPLHHIVQIWPYASLAQRAEVRRRASEAGIIPPPGALDALVSMESQLLLAAPCSPIQ